MRWAPHPAAASSDPDLELVTSRLDPVLIPLGFAAGQAAATDDGGQVIFCRGGVDGHDDGCVDLVVDLGPAPERRVVAVRYWGRPSETWNLVFAADAGLVDQVSDLARSVPGQLA